MNDRTYKNEDVVHILNPKQCGLYVKNGVKPIDLIYTDCLIFIFKREETKELYKLWMKRELK